ncbi:MAG: gliding motility protein GldL [Bacteroidaceae bacterium]|nr:gliding motility protein GldL [Bacteroidaceae bacterium]
MKKSKGIIGGIQAFMDSAKGKTVMNYFYSWGAAIVILGTLFKLTHLPGANIMLFLGMGTEVIVFLFSAFERPFEIAEEDEKKESATSGVAGQPIIINGPIMAGGPAPQVVAATPATDETTVAPSTEPVIIGGGAPATGGFSSTTAPVAPANIAEMDKATEEYVEKVRALTEAIEHISQQTEALGRNMEEMDTLSRNLTGVNALYEVHLRSAGGQLNAIDQVNDQTKRMAQQIEELNNLYARMIEAMTSKMERPQV